MDDRFQLDFACEEAWQEMREVGPGERRCEHCSETVVDLSRMTKKKALAVVSQAQPPCVSFLVLGEQPLFRRESVAGTLRGGLMAAAAGLLAACSTPEPPSCELVPEDPPSLPEAPSLLDGTASSGPLSLEVGAPSPLDPFSTVTPTQNGAGTDTARAGDPNDVDGASPAAPVPAVNHAPPANALPIHRRVGRMPLRHGPSVPTNLVGSS